MRDRNNIIDLLSLSPDYIGFIFYNKSSRYMSNPLSDISFGSTRKTGVFVNEPLHSLIKIAKEFRLDVIQLHGKESPEYCKILKEKDYEVIKAFSVDDDFNFDITLPYISSTDLFLFDAKGKQPGGNGVIFNWEKLKEYTYKHPFLLSGGISLKHGEIIKKLSYPFLAGIDVNSGFEIAPGLKDIKQLEIFINKIKQKNENIN